MSSANAKHWINNINQSKIKSNHIVSADKKRCESDQTEVIKAYGEIIKSNIEYDALIQANKFDEKLVQGIFELILETVVSQSNSIAS